MPWSGVWVLLPWCTASGLHWSHPFLPQTAWYPGGSPALPGGYGKGMGEHLLPFLSRKHKGVWMESASFFCQTVPHYHPILISGNGPPPSQDIRAGPGADFDSALLPSPKSAMCPAAKMNAQLDHVSSFHGPLQAPSLLSVS